MFKNKNTRIIYELLPDGRIYIETYLSDDARAASNFFCRILDKSLLEDTLRSIDHAGNITHKQEVAKEVINSVLLTQQPRIITKERNPLIPSDQVFQVFQQDINNEGE